jgi:hypothetical protein
MPKRGAGGSYDGAGHTRHNGVEGEMDFSSSVGRVGVLCVSTPVGTDKPPRGYKHPGRGIDVCASKRLEGYA